MTNKCEKCGLKYPVFGVILGRAERCKDCKTPEMFDVKNPRCQEVGCEKQTSYGFLGYRITHCSSHKKPGMINKRGNRCSYKSCKKTCCFRDKDNMTYCYFHSNKKMVCINRPLYDRQSKMIIHF
jgi:hypothetical protein